MYYLIYVYFDPSVSLYDDDVVMLDQDWSAYETIEEAYQYIENELVGHLKVDAAEGEVDPSEIEAVIKRKDDTRATVDLLFEGQLLYRYEFWIMPAWLYNDEIEEKNKK